MTMGSDERCAADVSNVVDGRGLGRDDAAWLARAVAGAVRPNRDKPAWDLAHLLAALAQAIDARDGRALVDLLLDPRLAAGDALQRRFAEATCDPQGFALRAEAGTSWRVGWLGARRLLALGEFVLTADDLAGFAEVTGWLDDLAARRGDAVDLTVKRLVRLLSAYRQAHMPLAPVEKRYRAILSFLGSRAEGRRPGSFDDDDVLDYWRAAVREGERIGFRTVAEHFLVFAEVAAALGGMAGVTDPESLDAIEGWEDRLDAALGSVVGEDPAVPLVAALAALGDGPKVLTGAERDDLADFLRLDGFHRTRPLTVLRAVSFGRVQSGIGNRLRRGSGGADVATRARCADAEPYPDLDTRARALQAHLDRMVRIAAALRLPSAAVADPRVAAALRAAEADLKRVRRAGFEDRAALATAFAALDDTLVRALEEMGAFTRAVLALGVRRPLPDAFEADRAVFAESFAAAYAGEFA